MQLFITVADLEKKLKPELLQQLVGNETHLYDEAIASAQAEVEAFLSQQFDMVTDLRKTGPYRSRYLVDLCAILAVGELLGRVTPKFVPDAWLDKVEAARKQLKMAKDGTLTPPDLTPRRTGTDQKPIGHLKGGGWETTF